MLPERINILLLSAFSMQGGIERFNRALLKALQKLAIQQGKTVRCACLHDVGVPDIRYFPSDWFHAYKGNRLWFIGQQLLQAFTLDTLVLGHVNMAIVGVLAKRLRPQLRLVTICHGIEVFKPLRGVRKKMLQQSDMILAVSTFTRDRLVELQGLPVEKITVFPNTLDPFFALPEHFVKPDYLRQRYGLAENTPLLFTLTRLNSNEGYKGYDVVVRALALLRKEGLIVTYLLAGKADAAEHMRMGALIQELELQQQVIMPGFIADEEVTDHYLLADAYVMPSKGEGFGIVYIEAMACGLPVIAGNKDGSTEALQFGKLGTLVDPDDVLAVAAAIRNVLQQPRQPEQIQARMLEHFSFARFEERVEEVFGV